MTLGLIGLMIAGQAQAAEFGRARLVDGTPDFEDCLESTTCADAFYGFLSNSLLDQGFAMQAEGNTTSAVVQSAPGLRLGAALATFPLGPPPENLSGKQENTSFSPVFPRLRAGWVGDGEQPLGLGLSVLPPIPVDGASALLVGVDVSKRLTSGDDRRFGVEASLDYVRALAPVAATDEQLEDRDSWSNPDNLDPDQYAQVCGTAQGGCKDSFQVLNLDLRAAHAWQLGAWTPIAKAGVTVVNERLHVMYDDTTWALFALQPALHGGIGWQPGAHLWLDLGASAALRQPNQDRSGQIGVLSRFSGAAGWIF